MQRPLRLLLLILVAVAAIEGRPRDGSAAVLISEIMYNPQGDDVSAPAAQNPFNREWVEIYNSGAEPIDLAGWRLGDLSTGVFTSGFPAGTTIGPGEARVITADPVSFRWYWGRVVPLIAVDAFPPLANAPSPSSGGVALQDSSGVIRNLVKYDDAGEWPVVTGSDGASIYVVPEGLQPGLNSAGTSWKPSSQGVYGARFAALNGVGENHASPGVVVAQPQAVFAPSPDAVWSMVVFPDTQNYAKSSANLPIFSQMTTWVKDNRELFNIQLVMQEGDIVNQNSRVQPTSGDQTANQQWANARAAMSILDGHVPYIMAVGNHDLGTTSAQTRDTQFNDYFQAAQNPLVDPAQGGILKGYYQPGKLENAFFELQAPDGRPMLIFSLEFWPRQEVVDWANDIAAMPEYENHTAVLLTHSYMNWNEQRTNASPDTYGVGGDSHDGEQLWHELVKHHGNFEMTFSGHVGGDGVGYMKSTGAEGNAVHQMLINSQFETNGGNGWMRVLEFLDDGTTVRVRTFSPFLGLYRTDLANSYDITLSPLATTPGDFNADGAVDAADLTIWKTNFGLGEGATRKQGDANGDGAVDAADFLLWQRNFGPAAGAAPNHPVPEPATLGMLLSMAAFYHGPRSAASVENRNSE